MSKGDHIIGRQVIELELRPDQDAAALQQEISWTFRSQIVPRLEALFDRMIASDVSIRLDRLELELPNIDPDQLAYSFTESVLQAIESALEEQLAALSVEGSVSTGNRKSRRELTLIESWWYFLENGYLPWWIKWEDAKTWENQLIQAFDKEKTAIQGWFGRKGKQLHVIQRLAWQFGDAFHEALGKILLDIPMAVVRKWKLAFLALGKALLIPTYSEAQILAYVWESVYRTFFLERAKQAGIKAWVRSFLQLLSERTGTTLSNGVGKRHGVEFVVGFRYL